MKKAYVCALLSGVLVAALTSCNPEPLKPINDIAPNGKNDRFEVTTAQEFWDGDHRRFILVLYDKQTKKEFLAVTGAGVVETHCTYDSSTKVTTCEEQ